MKRFVAALLSATMFSGAAFAASETFPVTFSAPTGSVTNSMTVSDASGAGETNYPLQFGRPFVKGAIPHAPQILVNGQPVPSQADVKNRYPDGSVEFAVMAAVLPSVPAGGSVTISFVDTTANSNAPLTSAQMLGSNYDFDAALGLAFPARIEGPALVGKLASFQAVTNGGLTISVNGTPYSLTGLNFSAIATMLDAQKVLQTALTAAGAPVIVAAPLQPAGYRALTIQTTATGAAASLSYASAPATGTDISAMLGWTAAAKFNANLVGSVATASARAMLTAGDCQPWTSGPIAQTMICADDSTARAFDMGDGDGYHPLRPRFYATFWPATNQVSVRAVVENDLSTEVEDMAYSATLTGGSASPTAEYAIDLTGDQTTKYNNQGPFPKYHWALTRWTHTFWLGGAPQPEVNIDDNFAYLRASRFVPNYDPSITMPASAITTEIAKWTGMWHDNYDGNWENYAGLWDAYMSSVGARQEIGPYPSWVVDELYSGGNWQLRQMMFGMADLAGAFPANYRETDPTRRLSRADPTGLNPSTGLGHVMSLTDRPSFVSYDTELINYGIPASNNPIVVGSIDANQPWLYESNHEPSPFYVPYLVTGDPYDLDAMYMWAGYDNAQGQAATRGPHGDDGAITGELRGAAWMNVRRAELAFIAPDAAPEKAFFTYLENDALAALEGEFHLSGTPYTGTTEQAWGITHGDPWTQNPGDALYGQDPPMHNWEANGSSKASTTGQAGDPSFLDEDDGWFTVGTVGAQTDMWMEGYLIYSLGRVAELGFAARPIQLYTGVYPITAITSTEPWIINAYNIPAEKVGSTWYSGWPDVFSDLTPQYLSPTGVLIDAATGADSGYANLQTAFAGDLNTEGYPLYQLAGTAMLDDAGAPGAAQAESWLQTNVVAPALVFGDPLAGNPKWDIAPRTDSNTLPAIPTATPAP